jgi:hypothetical protein
VTAGIASGSWRFKSTCVDPAALRTSAVEQAEEFLEYTFWIPGRENHSTSEINFDPYRIPRMPLTTASGQNYYSSIVDKVIDSELLLQYGSSLLGVHS